jgi:hypothetical protein
MHRRLIACAAAALVIALTWSGVSRANTGIQLPLNQYQAGTEVTTLVPNGNFELVTGSDANLWTETGGGMSAGAHQGGNINVAVMGAKAAQGAAVDLTQYRQAISTVQMNPAVDNVLSAYLWNFGVPGPPPHNITDFDPGDMAIVELGDGTNTVNIILEPIALDNGSAASGYFVYTTISAGTFPSGANLDVRVDLDTTGPWPAVVTQYDNVAITPASLFVPPRQIPEPASAMMFLVAGTAAVARRRCKNCARGC